jgi:hypothetical protein
MNPRLIKMALFAFILAQMVTSGCGTAKANDPVYIQRILGPDGTTCYVIMQGDRAVGGSCNGNG